MIERPVIRDSRAYSSHTGSGIVTDQALRVSQRLRALKVLGDQFLEVWAEVRVARETDLNVVELVRVQGGQQAELAARVGSHVRDRLSLPAAVTALGASGCAHTLGGMPKITISKLARMSQREFLEIRQTVTEELREMRAELAALRSEVATVGMDLDQRLLTVTDGLHLVLRYADALAARPRPRPAPRQRSRPLRARRGL